ncbi:MAG: ROK family protein, partial [Lentisphaeria bacterium]|nr:ROK family protein [Lentisphaeria bacterium]
RLDLGGLWEGKMISGVSKSKISVKHMKIGKSDQDCYCHRKGCLVLSASIWSIMDRYYGYQPGERGIQAYNIIENERNHMFDLIRKEDPILMPIIKSAAKDIADAIENLAVIFRPDAVFFNSWLSINRENGIDIIKKQFEDYATINKQAILECDIITHGEIQGAVGAAVMIIENNFGDSTPHLRISDFTKLLD